MVPSFAPMLAASGVPSGDLSGWSAEPKLDGWRALVKVDRVDVELRTRGGHQVVLGELASLAECGLRMVLDGELVAAAGRMDDFYAVAPTVAQRRRTNRRTLTFAAFDLLWLDGHDVTALPYSDRRRLLEEIPVGGAATVVPRWDGIDADALLQACETQDVEGLVLKRCDSAYLPGQRSGSWRKVKCSGWTLSHAERRRPTR